MNLFSSIVRYEYLQNAYIIGILIGIIAPLIGAYVVIKKQGLIVEGISHITLSGISFSMFFTTFSGIRINPMYFGVIFALFGSYLIEKIGEVFKDYKEISIPIAVSSAASFTALFISLSGGFATDLTSYLFGSILTTTKFEIIVMAIALAFVLVTMKNYYYKIICFSIDEDYCKFSNINVKTYKIIFTILIATVVSISIKAVGMMLIGSLVILPISTASKIAKSFKSTLITAIVISELSVLLGLVVAFYLPIPSGATIVLTNLLIFVTILFLKKGEKNV